MCIPIIGPLIKATLQNGLAEWHNDWESVDLESILSSATVLLRYIDEVTYLSDPHFHHL